MCRELDSWLASAVASGPSSGVAVSAKGLVDTLRTAETSVEAVSPGELVEGKPWPLVITFRSSEKSQEVKDTWLHGDLRSLPGPGRDMGVRPAR